MKVVSITPIHVTEEELKRRQARYERLAPAGITVELRNLSEQSLNALEREIAMSEQVISHSWPML